MADNEKQFEIDIESYLTSPNGGWQKATDAGYKTGFQYDGTAALQKTMPLISVTLCTFVKKYHSQ